MSTKPNDLEQFIRNLKNGAVAEAAKVAEPEPVIETPVEVKETAGAVPLFNAHKVKRLHRKDRRAYTTRFELEETDLTASTLDQYRIFKETYDIVDTYNNYFVDSSGNKLQPSDLVFHTNMLYERKGGPKPERLSLNGKDGCQVFADLMVYMQDLKDRTAKLPDEKRQPYMHFDYIPGVDVTEMEAYKEYNAVWSKWGLIDVVNRKPIIDSMCKIIAFIFTPTRSWRYFMVLESACSGWGKTAFINAICNNSDLCTHYIPQTQEIDKYTYSEMYRGKDVSVVDDPGKNMPALATEINNIVSTKRGCVRTMNKDPYTAEGVETRIVVTTNVPFRAGQDLKLDNKMICVKTNPIEDRNKDEQAIIYNLTNKYFNQAPKETIDRFISGCVDLLASDPTWISTHLGLHTDEEELGCKIAQLMNIRKVDGKYEFPAEAKTLEDLVQSRFKSGLSISGDSRDAAYRFAYTDICKELKTKCYEDRHLYNGRLAFMTGKRVKDKCVNFKLSEKVKELLLNALMVCGEGLAVAS